MTKADVLKWVREEASLLDLKEVAEAIRGKVRGVADEIEQGAVRN